MMRDGRPLAAAGQLEQWRQNVSKMDLPTLTSARYGLYCHIQLGAPNSECRPALGSLTRHGSRTEYRTRRRVRQAVNTSTSVLENVTCSPGGEKSASLRQGTQRLTAVT